MKKVEIYTTENCHFCHMAKEMFTEHNIPYTEYNVGADPEKRSEMVDKSGQMGVPVIVIDNKDLVVGFNEKRLKDLLEISN